MFYKQFMAAGSLVFDVGANMGNKTRQFLDTGARVIAFEPIIGCVEHLMERFKADPVTVVPCAVGAVCGEGDIEVGSTPNLSTLNPDWKRAVTLTKRFGEFRWTEKQHVGITTLDCSIERFGMPDFIKVDVEGYEDKVFLGLSHRVKACCFEFTPEHLQPMIESCRRLDSLGGYEYNYSLGETLEWGLEQWVDSHSIVQAVMAAGTDNVVYGDVYARLR